MRLFALIVSLQFWQCLADTPHACAGGQPLASFRLVVSPAKGGRTLPLGDINALRKGQTLLYEPVHIPAAVKDKAEIAVLLGPRAGSSDGLDALPPEPAARSTMWIMPRDASVVALIYGPQGLSMHKVKSWMERDREVLAQIADYADQTSQIAALVEALQDSEAGGGSVSAALTGFSARSGIVIAPLDPHSATSQQAAALLNALRPAVNAMDPLTAPNSAVMQQSAGLATTVAGVFLGNGVGLAAGGVALFQNMRAMLFPETEFRSTLAQAGPSGGLCLCARSQQAKARTRLAYLWAHRLPELAEPKLSLAGPAHLPLASGTRLTLHAAKGEAALLHGWRLAPVQGGDPLHVPATVSKSGDEIQLDLGKIKKPGEYRLRAFWDWDDLPVAGDVYLHPLGDMKLARLAPGAADRLVEGGGRVPLQLEGTDFEFVEKVSLRKAGPHAANPAGLTFDLPRGRRAGEQQSIETEIDTGGLAPGAYQLILAQSDGTSHPVPVTLLPPNPVVSNAPLRPNLGETSQKLVLAGSGLDRIEKITTDAGEVELGEACGAASREIVIKLNPKFERSRRFDLGLRVQGLEAPLRLAHALEIRGPRPRIHALRRSDPRVAGVALAPDELPAGTASSFSLSVTDAGQQPTVDVACGEPGIERQPLHLRAGDRLSGARLDLAGEGVLFLSLDPGAVGRSGCKLEARVTSTEGSSDPYTLGRVLRVPRIAQFIMTDRKIGDSVYAATLKGEDLDTIERTGWDAQHGLPVDSIPESVPGEQQILKVEQTWPAPSPHAPVFVWLRGEDKGRATGVGY